MDDLIQGGTDSPAGNSASSKASPSNSSEAADSLPLSVPSQSIASEGDGGNTDADKQARAIFRKLAKEAGGEEETDDGGKADELDADKLDDDGAPPAKAEEDRKPAGKKEEKSSDAAKPSPEAINDAREALVRDGFTLSDLEKLPPERLLELGSRRKQQQQAQDRFGSTKAQELAALKARLAELEPNANNPQQQRQQANTEAAKNQANSSDPVLAGIKEKLSKLGELASPEAQAAIEDALSHVYTSARETISSQVSAQLAAMTAATEQQLVKAARTALSGEFPDLKDDAKFSKVMEKATAFARSGYYGVGDMEALIKDAAATMFQPTIKDVQRQMLERSRKARDGQPDVGQQTAQKPKALTPDERAKSILKDLAAGKSPEQARRRALQTS